MVTNDVMKMATTCSAMIGHLFDIIIAAATDNDYVVLTHQSLRAGKLLETIVSLLNLILWEYIGNKSKIASFENVLVHPKIV